ncbi:phosphonate ABC transporter ATP-binding protein [Oceanicoccus sagamiensis]|uniref:ABC transporter domain-containing protein n=1 Tax=Oceanicoccus sagamiensis TaxID=716816 RepID=A0A1X9NF93_9GAMM|nr:ATP-binding cassette domain-containing protein [Oceanicoccus sagamiensis]ARN76196.1 hypothetical protein BST96_20075 [Oceanicoccus sagamiensis]
MSPQAQPLIRLENAEVFYQQQRVLDEVTLELHQGERIALLGKSGAGKSTLLKLIYQHLSHTDHRVGWVPQQLGLVDKLSVFHNIYMGQLDQRSRTYNLINILWPRPKEVAAISQLLERFNLEETLFKTVEQLSGGQQQRVAIARAIYSQADIILADEPASSLDKANADNVISALLHYSQSCVIALHNTEQALAFADRVIGIQQGKIVVNDHPDNLSPAQLAPLYDHD